jgi:uncharacterized membrane protein
MYRRYTTKEVLFVLRRGKKHYKLVEVYCRQAIFRQTQVELDKEVKVLYPGKSCSFDITRAFEKLMKVHCRDDPSICGTRQVEDISTLRASESFGSFGGEVADFVQKEQQQVEQEKSLLQKRKDRMEAFLEKERRENAFCVLAGSLSCTALFFGLLVVWSCLDPQDEVSALLLSLGVVLSLAALSWCSWMAQGFGRKYPGPRRKKLAYHGSFGCSVLGGLAVTIAIVRYVLAGFWWTVLAAGLPCCCLSIVMCMANWDSFGMWEKIQKESVSERTIVFRGKVLPGTGKCVCSWPGKYESAWDALVTDCRRGNISAAVFFLPEGSEDYGRHDPIPENEKIPGTCWCVPLYGEPKPWGCHWWTKWIANIEKAHEEGAEMEVYFFKGMKRRGKVRDFSTAGNENLRREAIQEKQKDFLQSQAFSEACHQGIECLSKEPREDSSSQYSREVRRLFLAWLPEEERHFMEASEGLGNSQKAEVAWLERKEYAYTEVEVDIFQWLQQRM